jgi:hypothetical protein
MMQPGWYPGPTYIGYVVTGTYEINNSTCVDIYVYNCWIYEWINLFFCVNSLMYLTQYMKRVTIINTRVCNLLTRKYLLFDAKLLCPAALCVERTQAEVSLCQSTCRRVAKQLKRSQKNVLSVSSQNYNGRLQRRMWHTSCVGLASATRPRVHLHLVSPATGPDAVIFEALTAVAMKSYTSGIYGRVSGANQPTFRKEILLPSSGSKSKGSKKSAWSKQQALFGLLFGPEDGGDTFLRNVCRLEPDYTELYIYPRR